MNKLLVSYASTGYFSKAIIDYIEGAEQLKPYYTFAPQLSSIPAIIEKRKQFPLYRGELCAALSEQYAPFHSGDDADIVSNQISSLKDQQTFTVVTAHQPNLFLGPLYLIYKIVSAIKLSQQLKKSYPDHHFVPVYWMGSEDHDKVELNNIHLFGKTYTWNTDQQGAFGRMQTASLEPLLEEIKLVLGNSEEAIRCTQLLDQCYANEKTIAAATKRILYHFFREDGLVIVDGDDASLKRLFLPVMQKELLEQFSFPVVKVSTDYFAKHYQSQITPREINLFYLDDGIRSRLINEGATWKVLNTELSFNEEQLLALLQKNPERLSPNVVLRPVYQEWVLPNVAFIGGGAEITYWMQLKEVFKAAGAAFPMLLLRNSALWIDHANHKRMNKLNISAGAIFKQVDILIKSFLEQQSGNVFSLEPERKQLDEIMNHVTEHVMKLDAGLKGAAEAEKVKMLKSLEALEEKLKKVVKKREEISVQQLQALKDKLFPGNSLQERHDNFLAFYLKYGSDFMETLKSNFDPMEQQFTVLTEE